LSSPPEGSLAIGSLLEEEAEKVERWEGAMEGVRVGAVE